MKKLFNSFLFLFFCSTVTVLAQDATKETEYHEKITTHQTKGREHAQAIMNGESKTTVEHKSHATEMGTNLNEAKKNHAALKASQKGKNKEAHAAIEKHHADAETHHKALNAELNKPAPDDKKVKEHATKYHESMTKASEEHNKTK